jgi:hypothetical protein
MIHRISQAIFANRCFELEHFEAAGVVINMRAFTNSLSFFAGFLPMRPMGPVFGEWCPHYHESAG